MNIVWKRPDGGISITHCIGESPKSVIALMRSRNDVPDDWEVVATGIEVPDDRSLRNAWAWLTKDPVIDICPDRAKEVTKDRLRLERAPIMAELDVKFMRALEAGDSAAIIAIGTEKQRLRDITAQVDAVEHGDLEALKALKCQP